MSTSPTTESSPLRNRFAGFSIRNAFKRNTLPAQQKPPPRQSGGSSNYSQVLSANSPAPPTRTNSSKLTEDQPSSAKPETDIFEGRIPPQYIYPPHPEPVITSSRRRSNSGNSIGGTSTRTVRMKLNSKKHDRLSEAAEEDVQIDTQAPDVAVASSSTVPAANADDPSAPLTPPRPLQDPRHSIPASYYSDEARLDNADPFAAYTPARKVKAVELPAGSADTTKPVNLTFDPRSSTYNFIHSTIQFTEVDVPEPGFSTFLDMNSNPSSPANTPKLEHVNSIRSQKSVTSSDSRSVTQRTRSALSRLSMKRNKSKKKVTDPDDVEWDLSPVGTMKSQLEAVKKPVSGEPEPFPEEEYKGWQTPPLRAVVAGQLAIAPPDSDYDQIKPFPAPPRSNPSPVPRSVASPSPPPLRNKVSASSFRSLTKSKHPPLASRRIYSHQVTGSESSIFFPVATSALPNRSGKQPATQISSPSSTSHSVTPNQAPSPDLVFEPKPEPLVKLSEPVVNEPMPGILSRLEPALSAIRESRAMDSDGTPLLSSTPVTDPLPSLPPVSSIPLQGSTVPRTLLRPKVDRIRPFDSPIFLKDASAGDLRSRKPSNPKNVEREIVPVVAPVPTPRPVEEKKEQEAARDSVLDDSDGLNDVYNSGTHSDGLTSAPQSARSSWWKPPEDPLNIGTFRFPVAENGRREVGKRERPQLTIAPPNRGSAPSPSPSNFSSLTTPGALLSALSGADDDQEGLPNDSGIDYPLFHNLETPSTQFYPRPRTSSAREMRHMRSGSRTSQDMHHPQPRIRSSDTLDIHHSHRQAKPANDQDSHHTQSRAKLTDSRESHQSRARSMDIQELNNTQSAYESTDTEEQRPAQSRAQLKETPESRYTQPRSRSTDTEELDLSEPQETQPEAQESQYTQRWQGNGTDSQESLQSQKAHSRPQVPRKPFSLRSRSSSPDTLSRAESLDSRPGTPHSSKHSLPAPSVDGQSQTETASVPPVPPIPAHVQGRTKASPLNRPRSRSRSSRLPIHPPGPHNMPSITSLSSMALGLPAKPPTPSPTPPTTVSSSVGPGASLSKHEVLNPRPEDDMKARLSRNNSFSSAKPPALSTMPPVTVLSSVSPGIIPSKHEVINPRPEDDMKARISRNNSFSSSKPPAPSPMPPVAVLSSVGHGAIPLKHEKVNPRPEDDMRARISRNNSFSSAKPPVPSSMAPATAVSSMSPGVSPSKHEVVNPRPEDDMKARLSRNNSFSSVKPSAPSSMLPAAVLSSISRGTSPSKHEVINPRPEDDMKARMSRNNSFSSAKPPAPSPMPPVAVPSSVSLGATPSKHEVLNPRPEDDMKARLSRNNSFSSAKPQAPSPVPLAAASSSLNSGASSSSHEMVDPRPEDDMRLRRTRTDSFSSTGSRRSSTKQLGPVGMNPTAPAWPIRPSLLESSAVAALESGSNRGVKSKVPIKIPKAFTDQVVANQSSKGVGPSGTSTPGSQRSSLQRKARHESPSERSMSQSPEHLVVELVSEGNPGYVSPHFYTRALPEHSRALSSGMSTSSDDQMFESPTVALQQQMHDLDTDISTGNNSSPMLQRATSPPPEYRPPSPMNITSSPLESSPSASSSQDFDSPMEITLMPMPRPRSSHPGVPETDSSPIRKRREPKLIPVLVEQHLDPPTPVFVAVSRPRPKLRAAPSSDSAAREIVSSRG